MGTDMSKVAGLLDFDQVMALRREKSRVKPKAEETETIKVAKGRKERKSALTEQQVRQACVDRDGDCIIGPRLNDPCEGASEWCHAHEKRRSKTRGQAPTVRHTTAGSFMGCSKHHKAYDAKQIQVIAKTAAGMNGAYVVRRTRKG